jgi:tetratricopeptide (TPR) repeat protein
MKGLILLFLFGFYAVIATGQGAKGADLEQLRSKVEATEGQSKIRPLLAYSKALRELNRPEAVKQAERALQLSRTFGLKPNQEAEVLANYLETCLGLFYINRAEEQLPQLNILLPQLADSLRLSLQLLAGRTLLSAGQYTQADQYLEKVLTGVQGEDNKAQYAYTSSLLADSYRYQGRYPEVMKARTAALEYYEQISDSVRIAENRVGIGIVQLMTSRYPEAKSQFRSSLRYYTSRNDSVGIGLAETALSLAYFKQDSLDQALEHAWNSFKIREALNDQRGLGESLNNLALVYMKRGMWGFARDYLEASLENREQSRDYRQIPVMLANLALCYRKLGNVELAESLYKDALARATASGADHAKAQAYEGFQLLEEERGNFEAAYRYALLHDELEDSLLGIEKERQLRHISDSYEKEKAALENEQLRMALDNSARERIGIVAIALLVGLIALLVWSRQRLRIKQSALAFELEKTKLEERMQNYMQRVLEKNTLVEKLEQQLATMNLQDSDAEARRSAQLNELRQMKILTEEDWRTFRQHFEQVYRGFMDRLAQQHPDLTKGEKRMFVLVKLNLSTSEIADILGISADSVKKARYRLRKKLQLSDDQPLNDFIRTF